MHRSARDVEKVLNGMGGAKRMFEAINPAAEATRSLATSPVVQTIIRARHSEMASRTLSDGLMEPQIRKARAEQASIDGTESTELLVDLAAKQEEAIESMASLLGQLVQTHVGMHEDQRRSARISRRWRWVTFAVALVAAGASVVNVVRVFVG